MTFEIRLIIILIILLKLFFDILMYLKYNIFLMNYKKK